MGSPAVETTPAGMHCHAGMKLFGSELTGIEWTAWK